MNFIQPRTVLLLFLLVGSIGCDYQSKIEVNDSAVWQYMEKGEEYHLARYLEERPSLVNEVNEVGNSLLYEAIASSNIKIVDLILANGAKINFRNQFGRTPLHRAADEDRLDMVKLLLAQGAEVNVRDCRGSTPLIASAEFASLPVLKLLVEAGANVPSGNHYGRSALHNAAKREDVSVAEFLIAHGARLNQVCEYGTPLDLTVNCEIAKLIRASGGFESSTTSIASRTHQRYLTNLPAEK
jgi:ankyrin repeat protein